jgi:hypothetical protein
MKLLVTAEQLAEYKSRQPIPLECENCRRTFYKTKNNIQSALKGNPQFALRFCSQKCNYAHRTKENHVEVECAQCGQKVLKQKSWLKKNKHNFCSKSCSAKYQNAHKTLGKSRKSKAEIHLAELICKDFGLNSVRENVRDILPSGLELDLYLPSMNLAIELNGPMHFFPIHGQVKLEAIRDNDIRKQIEAQQIGCNLIVLDISQLKYWKETKAFLNNEYQERLKPILDAMTNLEIIPATS